jgi:hypothetical protein
MPVSARQSANGGQQGCAGHMLVFDDEHLAYWE